MRSVSKKWLANLGAAGVFAPAAFGLTPALGEGLAPEYWEIYGQAEFEATLFAKAPRFAEQNRNDISFAIEPTLFAEWADGDVSLTVTPFARIDEADDERSHMDLREAKIDLIKDDWEVTVGADTVFWGKTEANHLVDIINQTDAVESLDDEASLGQPMLRIARLTDLGEFSAYYLPYVRLRTFAGEDGRLRTGLPVNNGRAEVRADGGRFAPSFALRFAGVFGDADIGLSAFHGVSRDPAFIATDFVNVGGNLVPTALAPVYDQITQFGFDGQYTSGPTLYKAEVIARDGQRNRNGVEEEFIAATGGVEYTLYGLLDNADLGLIGEYAWDSRGNDAASVFQNDVIIGARLALNDRAD
ncbi:MAG: hypothetical protein ACPGGK_08005, partial [Pikeienuella sp.]